MALEVGIVGLPNSGKTSLFNALTRAGAEVTAYANVPGKANVGMAPIVDGRLSALAQVESSRKTTPATLRVVDVAGTAAAVLGVLRQADALLAVVDGFSAGATPAADLETLKLELLLSDRDHVERRIETVTKLAKSGDPELRREVAELGALLAAIDAGHPLSEAASFPSALEPLTAKPLLAIENGPNGVDCKLEAELAELEEAEAREFREGTSALDEVTRRLAEALGLISFFTIGDTEARAWTLRRGQTALEAAGTIHTDLARGFIRCEVIHWRHLVEAGSRAEVARRGLQRLEGKTYVVADGDVLNVRFSPPRP